MKLLTVVFAVVAAFLRFGLLAFAGFCLPAMAAGFVDLPADGFALDDGSRSAYTLCSFASGFGTATMRVRAGVNDRCAIFVDGELTAPLAGFALLSVANREVVMHDPLTGGEERRLGSVLDVVWRNAERAECIYGARVVMQLGAGADYDAALPGEQYFRMSDLTRGGFAGREVAVAYASVASMARPVTRVGRTFTAVQYRGRRSGPAPGYRAQPPAAADARAAVVGVEAHPAVPEVAQQSAALDARWVTFTSTATALGGKRRSSAASSVFYVRTGCAAGAADVMPGAIRLRQTVAPFVEVSVPGFVPPGSPALLAAEGG